MTYELWQTEWCPASRRVRQRLTEFGIDYLDAHVPVERVREELKAEGFGVLCEIDVQATLREKLGVEQEPYLEPVVEPPHLEPPIRRGHGPQRLQNQRPAPSAGEHCDPKGIEH